MDPYRAGTRVPDPDAVEFIRFCYRRRRVGWPELYDEMCAVAARGLFRGLGADDLTAYGIGFGLFDMPALAAMAAGVVAQEHALRRPVAVMIAPIPDTTGVAEPVIAELAAASSVVDVPIIRIASEAVIRDTSEHESRSDTHVHLVAVPAGA